MSSKLNVNLQEKIFIAFLFYSLLLCSLVIIAVIVTTEYSLTSSHKQRISKEAEYLLRNFLPAFSAPRSNSFVMSESLPPYVTYYFGEESLPDWLDNDLKEREEGTKFLKHDSQSYCLLTRDLPGGEKFFLLYNMTTQGYDRQSLISLQKNIFMGLIPVLILGVAMGLITAHKVINPIIILSRIMKGKNPEEKLNSEFTKRFDNDEIGHLALVLKNTLNELHDIIENEISFARDASHELRTPVAAMKINLEILDKGKEKFDEHTLQVMSRLSNATYSMEQLIQSFLWLSRYRNLDSFEPVYLNPANIVQKIVDENSFLIKNKKIDVKITDNHKTDLYVEPNLFGILASNIIRNSFTYTYNGEVAITINDECFTVTDTGMGFNGEVLQMIKTNNVYKKAKGFGFGLMIVKKLCSSMGWHFYIKSSPGAGSEVKICYRKENSDACCGHGLMNDIL